MKRFVDATIGQIVAGGIVVGFIFLIIITTGLTKFSGVDELNNRYENDSSTFDSESIDDFDVNYQE